MISQVKGYKMSTCFLCDAPCENKCPVEGCETYYCSLEHLRHHQIILEDGRTLCMPFKIDHSPTKGRHFVATRFDQPFEMSNIKSSQIFKKSNSKSLENSTLQLFYQLFLTFPPKLLGTLSLFSEGFNSINEYQCPFPFRNIRPLELIVHEDPAVVGPATKTKPLCLNCLQPATGEDRYIYLTKYQRLQFQE